MTRTSLAICLPKLSLAHICWWITEVAELLGQQVILILNSLMQRNLIIFKPNWRQKQQGPLVDSHWLMLTMINLLHYSRQDLVSHNKLWIHTCKPCLMFTPPPSFNTFSSLWQLHDNRNSYQRPRKIGKGNEDLFVPIVFGKLPPPINQNLTWEHLHSNGILMIFMRPLRRRSFSFILDLIFRINLPWQEFISTCTP